jgi:hypothetical protein
MGIDNATCPPKTVRMHSAGRHPGAVAAGVHRHHDVVGSEESDLPQTCPKPKWTGANKAAWAFAGNARKSLLCQVDPHWPRLVAAPGLPCKTSILRFKSGRRLHLLSPQDLDVVARAPRVVTPDKSSILRIWRGKAELRIMLRGSFHPPPCGAPGPRGRFPSSWAAEAAEED